MIKKIATSLCLIFLIGTSNASPSLQNKIVPITFVGDAQKSAEKLSKAIKEQVNAGWEYDSYIDLKDTQFDTKLLIFKK